MLSLAALALGYLLGVATCAVIIVLIFRAVLSGVVRGRS